MARHHIYLIASLPMLHFPGKPPIAYSAFLEYCRGLIPDQETETLSLIPRILQQGMNFTRQPTLAKWIVFETALRNELVKVRSQNKKLETSQYLRGEGYPEPAFAQIAANTAKNPSPLEAELILDKERWQYLDELSFGHHFDFDFLVVYALKLLILKRWDRINKAEKPRLIEALVATEQEGTYVE